MEKKEQPFTTLRLKKQQKQKEKKGKNQTKKIFGERMKWPVSACTDQTLKEMQQQIHLGSEAFLYVVFHLWL